MNQHENKALLTLPNLSVRLGVSLDKLRDSAGALASAGLISKVGPAWVIEAARVNEVPAVLAREAAARRSHKAKSAK